LGAFVVQTTTGLSANHIPWMYLQTPTGAVLRAHVARANAVWQTPLTSTEAMVIFQGPQAYVTPSWYPSKQAHGKMVPTWAYMVAHVYGQIRFIEDREWLLALVSSLSDSHEAQLGGAKAWHVSDAPSDYIDKLLGAIVGVEICIDRMFGKFKLDQNKAAIDRQGVADGLREQDHPDALELAERIEMKSLARE
jgi:transcriptional regulator